MLIRGNLLELWKSHGFGCVSKSLPMDPPSAVAAGAAAAGGDVDGRGGTESETGVRTAALRIRVFHSSSKREDHGEDGLRLSPSGTNIKPSSKSQVSRVTL